MKMSCKGNEIILQGTGSEQETCKMLEKVYIKTALVNHKSFIGINLSHKQVYQFLINKCICLQYVLWTLVEEEEEEDGEKNKASEFYVTYLLAHDEYRSIKVRFDNKHINIFSTVYYKHRSREICAFSVVLPELLGVNIIDLTVKCIGNLFEHDDLLTSLNCVNAIFDTMISWTFKKNKDDHISPFHRFCIPCAVRCKCLEYCKHNALYPWSLYDLCIFIVSSYFYSEIDNLLLPQSIKLLLSDYSPSLNQQSCSANNFKIFSDAHRRKIGLHRRNIGLLCLCQYGNNYVSK